MKHFIQAYRKAFDFQGRATRTEFWMFSLIYTIVILVLGFLWYQDILSILEDSPYLSIEDTLIQAITSPFFILYGLFAIISLIPTISISIRRLHDSNRTGWYFVVPILASVVVAITGIPILDLIAMIFLLVLFCMPSTEGPNQYGVNEGMSAPTSDLY